MNKRYQIIYADPPWKYATTQHQGSRRGHRNQSYLKYHNSVYQRGAKDQYSLMAMQDIKNLGIDLRSHIEDNCLLFLWICSPLLREGIELGESWGFSYKTVAFVWYKEMHNPGNYTMSECELVFKRGKIPQPRGARNIRQFLAELRGEHSQKPAEIRNRIYQMFPKQNKLELFARRKVEGWDCWGNEAESDIEL
ncbi:hypothetical protein ES703_69958 [subsurface metagenome]